MKTAMDDVAPAWVEVGWAATDPTLIAAWKAQMEARMRASPHTIGAMSPQPGRPAKAVDAVGVISGFAVSIRPEAVSTLGPPEGLIPMAAWAAAALFAGMDDGPAPNDGIDRG